ncbi:unnamed protein product [Prorocentrum cordatum]|uniref:Ion transport domain-containing protein n=1 Tax=Prorocentrum cordatum TaxID=2364126 RepID=A0ABN9PE76_9DINO|nr:unnamed protein product [Polarella glacialis]
MGRTPRAHAVSSSSPRLRASSHSPKNSPRGGSQQGAPKSPRDRRQAPVPPIAATQLDAAWHRAAARQERKPTDGMLGDDFGEPLSFRSQLAKFQQYLQPEELLDASNSARQPPPRPGQLGQAPASLHGQLEQALARHAAALQETAAQHKAELTRAAELIGQELGRAVGEALLRGQGLAASSARGAPSAARAGGSVPPQARQVEDEAAAGGQQEREAPKPSPPSPSKHVVAIGDLADVDPAGNDPLGGGEARRMSSRGGSDSDARRTTKESSCSAANYSVLGYSERTRFERLIRGVTAQMNVEEPQHHGLLAEFVQSRAFDISCNLVVLLNCIFVVWAANHSVGTSDANDTIALAEFVFTAFYCVELVLKLWVHRLFFFTNEDAAFNILDLALVLMALFEISILPLLQTGSGAVDPTFLRILRIFKVVKVLRMMRALHAFKDIRVMIDCLVHSVWPLVWASALLGFLSSLFAIYFVQSVAAALSDGNLSPAQEKELLEHFGQVETALFSLIVATTGGNDWAYYYERLEPLGGFACVVYVVYIMFMFLAVMNIVTSVFLDKAMEIAKPCSENEVLDKCHSDLHDADELIRMVSGKREDDQDTITFGEFVGYMNEREFRKHFDARGLTQQDTRMLFKMLTSYNSGTVCQGGEKRVQLSAFLAGCMRLKGEASDI